jgi:hypothetical protein
MVRNLRVRFFTSCWTSRFSSRRTLLYEVQNSCTLHLPVVDLHRRRIYDCWATNNSLYPIFRYTINFLSTKLHLHASLTLFIPWNQIALLFTKSTFAQSCNTYSSPISNFFLHVSAVSRHQYGVYTPVYVQHNAIRYVHISSKRFPQQCSQDVK